MKARAVDRRPVVLENTRQTRTKVDLAPDTDINNIMRKHTLSDMQLLTHQAGGQYLDVSQVGSYAEALEIVLNTQDAFMQVPAEIREKFQNDPSRMIDLLGSKKEEDIKLTYDLGLRVKPVKKNQEVIDQLKELNENLKPKKA